MAGGWNEVIFDVPSHLHHSRILWNKGGFPPAAPRTVRDLFPEAPSSGSSPPLTLLFHFFSFPFIAVCFRGKKSPAVCEGQRSLICAELNVLLKLTMSCLTLTSVIIIWIRWSSSTFFLSPDSIPLRRAPQELLFLHLQGTPLWSKQHHSLKCWYTRRIYRCPTLTTSLAETSRFTDFRLFR